MTPSRVGLLALLAVLTGCASMPSVPSQNILMFSGDGKAVDATGNANCVEGAGSRGPLCHGTLSADETVTHIGFLGYTELDDAYFEDTYLERLFACMRAYFGSSPARAPGPACRQDPALAPRPTTSPDVRRILIFIHGGLNTQIGSIERVIHRASRAASHAPMQYDRSLYNEIAAAGYYPVFINWRASFTSNYVEGLFSIRQGEKRRVLGPATAPAVFFVDVGRSLARAPLVWAAQTMNDLRTTPGFAFFLEPGDPNAVAIKRICAYEYPDSEACPDQFRFKQPPFCVPFNIRSDEELAGDRNFERRRPSNPEALAISVGDDLRGCAEMSASLLSYVLTVPSRFLSSAVVDAMGTSAWEIMLRRTRLLFSRDDEFRREEDGAPAGPAWAARRGGVSVFLRRLAQEIKRTEEQGSVAWEIALVGHSIGAVIANQILRQNLQLELGLPIKHVVYMASAASVRDVLDSLIAHLRADPQARFYNLMLHPIADQRESYKLGEIPIDPFPRGSLLVMIDNFLSKPLTYLDRTAGRYENFLPAVHLIPQALGPRIHVKTFSVGRAAREASLQRHGEFTTRFKFWVPDCWKAEPAMEKVRPADCVYGP